MLEVFDGHQIRKYGESDNVAFGYELALSDKTNLITIAGLNKEKNALLGMTGTGAYNFEGSRSNHTYLGLKSSASPNSLTNLFGQFFFGKTTFQKPDDSIIAGATPIRTTSFKAGISRNDHLNKYEWSVQLSQPPRIESGHLMMDLVDEYDQFGNLHYKNQSVGLAPSGRQLDFGAHYSIKLKNSNSLKFKTVISRHPGHAKTSDNDWSGFVGYVNQMHKFGVGIYKDQKNVNEQASYNWSKDILQKSGNLDFRIDYDSEDHSLTSKATLRMRF